MQREKIKHKAADTRHKRKREARKNPQKKSKKPQDLGIPNNFPYKDQILAEVAEQRRIAAEEKQLRKEAKKLAKAGVEAQAEEDSEAEIGFSSLPGVSKTRPHAAAEASSSTLSEDADEEAPVLVNPDLHNLEAVLDKADVVLELIDARDPLAYRSSHVEDAVKSRIGKKLLFVLNKIDTCPKESIESWTRALGKEHPVFLFRSASAFLPDSEPPTTDPKGKGKKRMDDALGLAVLLEHLEALTKELKEERPLVVAVTGLTNVGKSSFVNSLARKATLPVYKLSSTSGEGPTTTIYPQEVTLSLNGCEVNVIDTPGLSWQRVDDLTGEEAERYRTQDILLRSKGHIERLKDPLPVVSHIVARALREDLMLFYNIPAFAEGDLTAFLSGVARANSLIKKGGVLDLGAASKIVLRDWRTGKFPRYTVPSPTLVETAPPLSESNEKIISMLKTRKEMRNGNGVVKLKAGEVQLRKVDLDAAWISVEDSDEEDEDELDVDEEEEADEGSVDVGESEEGDGDEDEEDEDEEELAPPRKRKQAPVKAIAPPKKKVAFSAKRGPVSQKPAPAKGILKVSNEKPKSSLKAKVTAKEPKPAPKVSKVANPSGKTQKSAPAKDNGAYDFGKFF
ncbi:unnamed protein product [Somion occarium]|uniref:CP-type G domain-containing protein n=1 Tax=Somion occarium TaxID=3059160 RepID=A0ABP1D957_9APHY